MVILVGVLVMRKGRDEAKGEAAVNPWVRASDGVGVTIALSARIAYFAQIAYFVQISL
jgi:hypothetical protein